MSTTINFDSKKTRKRKRPKAMVYGDVSLAHRITYTTVTETRKDGTTYTKEIPVSLDTPRRGLAAKGDNNEKTEGQNRKKKKKSDSSATVSFVHWQAPKPAPSDDMAAFGRAKDSITQQQQSALPTGPRVLTNNVNSFGKPDPQMLPSSGPSFPLLSSQAGSSNSNPSPNPNSY